VRLPYRWSLLACGFADLIAGYIPKWSLYR